MRVRIESPAMDISKAIRDLIDRGYTETRIAEEISVELGEPVSQSQINRIKLGRVAKPSYSVGTALVALHERVCKPSRRKPPETAGISTSHSK